MRGFIDEKSAILLREAEQIRVELTPRQRECAILGAANTPLADIATSIGISENSVLQNIRRGEKRVIEVKMHSARQQQTRWD